MASKRLAIETAPALHLLPETGGIEMKAEGTKNSQKRTGAAYAAAPPLRPAAQKEKRPWGVGATL
jgi:hypothetical protein